jgi:hypothetical protein
MTYQLLQLSVSNWAANIYNISVHHASNIVCLVKIRKYGDEAKNFRLYLGIRVFKPDIIYIYVHKNKRSKLNII